jgi:hypothetical protein
MKLNKFIEELNKIAVERGGDLSVVMADNISVVNPVFIVEDNVVVITDIK